MKDQLGIPDPTSLYVRTAREETQLAGRLEAHRPMVKNPAIDRVRVERRTTYRSAVTLHAVSPPKVSVVVPARNEAKNLPLVLSRIPTDVFEIIIVDGNSTDGTADVAMALRDDVRVIGQDRPGKGNALICGFREARGDIILMIDADGSMDGGEIPRYVHALLDGADFVKGSRYAQGGGSSDLTFIRSAGNRALRTTVNTLFGSKYSDLCYGYSAFWSWTLPYLELDCDGFEIETLMNIRAITTGLKIFEVPSFEMPRVHGESNLKPMRDGLRIARTIASERTSRRRTNSVPAGRRRWQPNLSEQ
ncbi:MAG: glycosyltransferase family 2 protein [Solirubrobacterales bacterium]